MAITLSNTNTTLNLYANDPIETDDGSFGQYSNTFGLLNYKLNFTLNHQLPFSHTTAVYLPILNLKRNGPYGYPSWKQIRAGENNISRTHRKQNILTFVNHPVEKIIIQNGKRYVISHRDDTIRYYDEPPVVAKHKPLEALVLRPLREGGSPFPVTIKADFNNGTNMMTNKEVNAYAKAVTKEPESYNTLKSMYLNGALEDPSSPISGFSYLKFNQTVFPPEKHTFKFTSKVKVSIPTGKFWKDKRHERSANSEHDPQGSDGFWFDGSTSNRSANRSLWPLDVSTEWSTRTLHPLEVISTLANVKSTSGPGIGGYNTKSDFGILQNNYSNYLSGGTNIPGVRDRPVGPKSEYGGIGRPAVLYNRKHRCALSSSIVSATGRTDLIGADNYDQEYLFAGEAAWDAPVQAGRNPFDDNVEIFSRDVKNKYKNYGVIPEYTIDKHFDFYLENSHKAQNLDLFSFPEGSDSGGGEIDISSEEGFYKTYSTSDLLKNLNIVVDDHKGFADPSSIKLTCNAVLKLMPYDGFYPAQRSVDLGQSFYNSYKHNLSISSSMTDYEGILKTNIENRDVHTKPFMQSMFAPGIWFNTIKSGIAVDCAIPSGSLVYMSASDDAKQSPPATANPYEPDGDIEAAFGYGGAYYIDGLLLANGTTGSYGSKAENFFRVPFESMLEPETYLKERKLFDMEPHHSSSMFPVANNPGTNYGSGLKKQIATIWDGKGAVNYKKMANNFLSEIPEFFLESKNFTTFKSLPQGDDQFGNFEAGKKYSMRVKLGKTFKNGELSFPINPACHNPSSQPKDRDAGIYKPPSVTRQMLRSGSVDEVNWPEENITMYSRPTAFGPPFTAFSYGNPIVADNSGVSGGSNYTWTPPYYEGSAFADIEFSPSETKKYSIQEILNLSDIKYYRYYHDDLADMPYRNFDAIAMQVSASVNIFSVETPEDSGNVLFVSSSNTSGIQNDKSRLCIQTKFETPILNFNSVETSSMTLNNPFLTCSIPTIGMWHQYGSIPANNEMIYLGIEDIPFSWYLSRDPGLNKDPRESLADALGFEKNQRRLGELAKSKTIKEAVVAVPFYDEGSVRRFFRIPRADIDNAIGNEQQQNLTGDTTIDMVNKMKQYNFPPSMDFLTYKDVDPFAMYIFEFKHTLDRQDLSYIWQNLIPDIGLEHKEASATITHELLAHELLGGGSKIINTGGGKILDVHAKGDDLNPEIRWMVFKVKYKAKHDYYEKIIGKRSKLDVKTANINYNWPYDFFSLVELVKLDASVELSQIEKDELTGIRKLKPINSPNPMPVTRNFRNGIKKK